MLNLEENIEFNSSYNTQKDLILKGFFYSISLIILLEWTRGQVPEVNLLQLIPGFYLFLLFVLFLFFLFFSNYVFNIPIFFEKQKNLGTKTLGKINYAINVQFALYLFLFITTFNLNAVIPISLDSFNNYGEKTLESLWSFNEVINLEIFLLILLSIISQIPTFFTLYLSTEQDTYFLPRFWRFIILFIVVISGFLTPTIDGYTQLSFSFSAFSLYIILLLILKRRVNIKYNGITFFGF
jgi:hypothetical protein